MPLKLPIKASAPRVKSPAPRTRPSRLSAPSPTRQSSSSQRSRSHDDRDRRPSDSSSSRCAQGSSSGRPRSRHRRSPSPDDRHERRRRRGSSSSPERYSSRRDDRGRRDYKYDDEDDLRRRRRLSAVDARDRDSYAYDDAGRRSRRSSVDHRSPSLRVGAAPGAFNREGENDPRNQDHRRRSSTPDKYKPDKSKAKQRSPSPPPAKPAAAKPAASPVSPPPAAETSSSSSGGASALFNNMPTAIAAYAGLKTLSKQADSAKEWIDWFTELSDTPEEIQELSDKADVARDTIKQVQQLIKARPDLLEGDKQGEALKEQIEDAVDSTNKALGKMTKLLAEISKKSGGSEQGNMMRDFWRSYRYRDEFKDKIEKADVDVQKELTGLSKLMLNLNTRALMKPPPPAAAAAAAGKETPEPAKKDEPKPTEAKPEPKPAETKPQTAPVTQGLKEGVREGLVVEGLKKPEEPKDQKEDPAKPAEKPPADGLPKVEEVPKKVEIPSPAVSTPSIVEPGPSLQDKERVKATEPERKAEAVPPSPSAIAREEAAIGSPPIGSPPIGSPPILITEPTKSTASSPSLSREPSSANTAQKRDPSPARDEPEQSPEDALLDAAWDGNLEAAIKALRQVSPRVCDDHGLTPLHLSAERDKMPVSMLLLDRGASISARSDGGRMPLHLAARSATAPMVEMLLERGKADPNAQTSKGRTALHYAASKAVDGDEERREVLRVLRDWGADPTIKDGDGETARDVAQKREHWDAAATLRRAEKKWEEDHKQNWLQRHGFVKK